MRASRQPSLVRQGWWVNRTRAQTRPRARFFADSRVVPAIPDWDGE